MKPAIPLVGAVTAALMMACGCGGGSSATTTSTPTVPDSADAAQVTTAYTTFFDGTATVAQKVATVQYGARLRSMLADASKNPQFQQMSAKVHSVRILTAAQCATAKEASPCAEVVHDVFIGPVAAQASLVGYAVKVGSSWRVSASTWCALVKMGGADCPKLPS